MVTHIRKMRSEESERLLLNQEHTVASYAEAFFSFRHKFKKIYFTPLSGKTNSATATNTKLIIIIKHSMDTNEIVKFNK